MFENLKPSSFPHLNNQRDELSQYAKVRQIRDRCSRISSYLAALVLAVLLYICWCVVIGTDVDLLIALVSSVVPLSLFCLAGAYVAAIEKRHNQWLRDRPSEGPLKSGECWELAVHRHLATWWCSAYIAASGSFVCGGVLLLSGIESWWSSAWTCFSGAAVIVTLMRRNRHRRLAQPAEPVLVPSSNSRPHLRVVE